MSKFVITRAKSDEFYFVLKASNGKTILVSEMYTSLQSCEKGAFAVAENSQYDEQFERLISKNGAFYFRLVARNGEVIGTSEMYVSEAGREGGIRSVRENAGIAKVGML